ncbi:MAG: hypothetical protein FWE38_01120 [Firmicutes bacterium]|nr:hypothetical protein [Bacillota bacterium]
MAEQKDRLGTITLLAGKQIMGATALMKCLYLLQEVFDVPLDYDYTIYTYGPYCAQVAADIDFSTFYGYTACRPWQEQGYSGRDYEPGDNVSEADTSFAQKYEKAITTIAETFAVKQAKELELIATIVYVHVFHKRNNPKIEKKQIVTDVNRIKPHFDISHIEREYDNLVQEKFLR